MWIWIALCAHAATLGEAFPPPDGAARVDGGTFGAWLLARELAPADQPVRTHTGDIVRHRARVIRFPMVRGDLQQCADTAIRLRAEFLRETGGEILYHATSGDPLPWTRWQAGERPYEEKGRVKWRPGTDGGWEAYLTRVFLWAGTRSLALDTDPVDAPAPGDVVVVPGGPGHAVVLLDVATRDDRTWVLVGEGFMPAQDLHVELGPDQGWWPWEDGVALPHWHMPASGLRRWKR